MLRKIQSDSGASLSFALLIFLVCTVVGSVILTSGTASSGRLSRLRDMDKRYYSVESAANLIRTSIDGVEINAVYEIKDDEITGDITFDPVSGDSPSDDNLFHSLLKEAVESMIREETVSKPWHELNLTGNLSGTALEQLNATAIVNFNTDGVMNFVISNTDEEETYSVSVNMNADFHQTEETVTETVTVDDEEQEIERTFIHVNVLWKGGEIQVA